MKAFEVLVVDDDSIITMLHNRLVINSGLHESPRPFYCGQDALNFIRNNRDRRYLVLLDINMPGISGWDFLDRINREDLSGLVQVVMITSSVDSADAEHAGRYATVIDYIAKPLTLQNLVALQKMEEIRTFTGP
ncbi:MAG: response regulator [Cyclonatronaceae bacterium]